MREFEIPFGQLERAKKKIERLQKKATKLKLGYAQPALAIGEPYTRYLARHELEMPQPYRFVKVFLSNFGVIKIGNWTILAAVDHGEKANVIRTFNDEYNFASYVTAKPTCDHCKTNRKRKSTYLIRDESGNVQRIGSTCLQDFTGHDPAHAISCCQFEQKMLGVLAEFDGLDIDGLADHATRSDGMHLELLLARVNAAVAHSNGAFVTRSQADNDTISTVDLAVQMSGAGEYAAAHADYDIAKGIIAWAEKLDGKTTFDSNMKSIALNRYATRKQYGIAGYMFEAKRKADERRVTAARRAAQVKTLQHVGTVSKREVFVVTLQTVRTIENAYGQYAAYTYRHLFTDADGNELIWWGSKDLQDEGAEVGGVFRIKATVKEHKVYRECPQTIIQRVKIVSEKKYESV